MKWIFLAVILLWLGTIIVGPWALSFYYPNFELTKAGQFGDMFGSINALFSGGALLFVAYTMTMQKKELSQQIESSELRIETEQLFSALKNKEYLMNTLGDQLHPSGREGIQVIFNLKSQIKQSAQANQSDQSIGGTIKATIEKKVGAAHYFEYLFTLFELFNNMKIRKIKKKEKATENNNFLRFFISQFHSIELEAMLYLGLKDTNRKKILEEFELHHYIKEERLSRTEILEQYEQAISD